MKALFSELKRRNEAYAYRGEADKAFMWLDRAYQARDPGLSGIKRSVFLQRVQKDPRFGAMVRKLKLPES